MTELLLKLRSGAFLNDAAFDLHLHSTASDGSDSPEALAKKIWLHKLRFVALTDHDTVAGVDRFRQSLKALDPQIEVLRGCEMTSVFTSPFFPYTKEEIHLLLYFDAQSFEAFNEVLETERQHRLIRNEALIKKLQSLGYPITLDELYRGDPERTCVRGRVHAAKLLVEKNYFSSINEAFSKLLNEGQEGYVPRQRPPVEAVLEKANAAGALTVLAHPALYGWLSDRKLLDGAKEAFLKIKALKDRGLQGLEVWHGDAQKDEQRYLKFLAQSFNLFMTGGSDYHGSHRARTLYTKGCLSFDPGVPVVMAGLMKGNKIFLAKRAENKRMGGFWEFPGGKKESGESLYGALLRELKEELNLTLDPPLSEAEPLPTYVRLYPTKEFDLSLAFYRIKVPDDCLISSQEHSEWGFFSLDEALRLNILPADIKILEQLKRDG